MAVKCFVDLAEKIIISVFCCRLIKSNTIKMFIFLYFVSNIRDCQTKLSFVCIHVPCSSSGDRKEALHEKIDQDFNE